MALTGQWFIPVGYKLAQEQAGSNILNPVVSTVKLMLLTSVPDHTSALIDFLSDVNANEVATGTGYVAGGPTMTTVAITDNLDGTVNFDMDDVVIAEDNSTGFTNCVGGVVYTDNGGSAVTSRLIYILNAGGTFGNTAGNATITINAAGVATR